MLAAADDKDRNREAAEGCDQGFMQRMAVARYGASEGQINQALRMGWKFNGEFEMTALPSRAYGDPADFCDERRKLSDLAAKQQERERQQKRRKIQRLTKQAMKGKR